MCSFLCASLRQINPFCSTASVSLDLSEFLVLLRTPIVFGTLSFIANLTRLLHRRKYYTLSRLFNKFHHKFLCPSVHPAHYLLYTAYPFIVIVMGGWSQSQLPQRKTSHIMNCCPSDVSSCKQLRSATI